MEAPWSTKNVTDVEQTTGECRIVPHDGISGPGARRVSQQGLTSPADLAFAFLVTSSFRALVSTTVEVSDTFQE